MRPKTFSASFFCLLALLLASAAASAATEKILYAFKGGTDGNTPEAGLVFDGAGNLYGTTYFGGAHSDGTIFQLTPGTGGKWTESVIYSFGATGTDGLNPISGLVIDSSGVLYGTTAGGGTKGHGTIYKLAKAGGVWKVAIIHNFSGLSGDGAKPQGGVIFGPDGNLYGATYEGGGSEIGVAYELALSSGKWVYKQLHSFSSNGIDGQFPMGNVAFDANGNLYGTTSLGGSKSQGVVYELIPGSNGKWTEKLIKTFDPSNGLDGGKPEAGVAIDTAGNLYGTTSGGGKNKFYGVVYEMVLGTNGKWTQAIPHTFTGGPDGSEPDTPVILDSSGNIYGTTFVGGTDGVAFKLTKGSNGKWTETPLHNFKSGPDGSHPLSGFNTDAQGNFYGTTSQGGAAGVGVVYEITP